MKNLTNEQINFEKARINQREDRYRKLYKELREALARTCLKKYNEDYSLNQTEKMHENIEYPYLKALVDILCSAIIHIVRKWDLEAEQKAREYLNELPDREEQ